MTGVLAQYSARRPWVEAPPAEFWPQYTAMLFQPALAPALTAVGRARAARAAAAVAVEEREVKGYIFGSITEQRKG